MDLAFDPLEPLADPYPVFRRLRDQAPVHWSPERRMYSVTRYDDVMQVLKTPEVFSSRAMFTMLMAGGHERRPPLTWGLLRMIAKLAWRVRLNPLEFHTARNLIAEDGDSHAQLRSIVNRGFTPRRVAGFEPRARQIVAECVAPLHAGRPFDVVGDLAIPLPVTIIAEMLGVPADRLEDFKHWSDLVIEVATGPGRDDRFAKKYADGFTDILVFIRQLVHERRAHPTDDLISTILAQEQGAAGLSEREVLQFVLLLLVAGNETTTNLIGNLVLALLEHPAEAERVAADPARVPELVEEGLRYDTPVQVVFRTTVRDTTLRDTPIPAGSNVAVFLASANRDERRYPDPDRLDLDRRARGVPAFGFGHHFCLGASLARLEARVAMEALAPALPKLERADATLERIPSFLVRGPVRLRLRPHVPASAAMS